nr:hypothetical protein GCM10020093_104700 [Planobispora longispora]
MNRRGTRAARAPVTGPRAAMRDVAVNRVEGMRFVKGHGTENDFVILPDPEGELELPGTRVAALCDRRAGIGGDGVLRVVRTKLVPEAAEQAGEAEWFMDYRNADGSVAEMCGNGVRVFARYLVDSGLAAAGEFGVATRGGIKRVRLAETGDVTVDMGMPRVLGRAARPSPVRSTAGSAWTWETRTWRASSRTRWPGST